MRSTRLSGGVISLMALAIVLSMIVAAGAITWPSPVGEKTIVVTDSELFSEPVMTFNQSVSQYDPVLGLDKYQDAHLQATEFRAGDHYWFDFSSIPSAEARKRLAQNGPNL